MFSEKQLNGYKNITAPQELYDKITSEVATKSRYRSIRRITKYIVASTACFAIVMCFILFSGTSTPEIICNGQLLDDTILFYDISPASDMRASPVFSVPFELILDTETEISISHGAILTSDGVIYNGSKISGKVSVFWEIPRNDELPDFVMTLKDNDTTTYITLIYNNAEKTITATKTTK